MLGITFILLFSFVLVTTGKSVARDDASKDDLPFPDKYTCEAKRWHIGSGLIEDFKIWYKENASRIDYNNGATTTIVLSHLPRKEYGVQFEIHLEANKDEDAYKVCKVTDGTEDNQLEALNIMPYLDNFKTLGTETINDILVVKLYEESDSDTTKYQKTLWARYDRNMAALVPMKYEEIAFNIWLGNLKNHEVWEFRNFKKDFPDNVYFAFTDYTDCTKITISDENVTKHLSFINPEKDEHVDYIFNKFKTKYNRKYADGREHARRKLIFQQNMRLISSRNQQNRGYKLGINQFADHTPEEMKRHKGLFKRKNGAVGNIPFPYDEKKIKEMSDTLPKEFDARLLGLVSPVKYQHDCGSCWTFGTTAAVEGALARNNGGRLISLSNQALIDCAWAYDCGGCHGGLDTGAYKWMMEYGMPTVEEYGGYLNKDGNCHIKNMTKTYRIKGFTDVSPNSVDALKVALINYGPLSVSVNGSPFAFKQYSGGIFYDPECSSTELDHEVALVGYGEENGETFWILKNSWGQTWGIAGYMHISARDNMCGVATEPTYVVI